MIRPAFLIIMVLCQLCLILVGVRGCHHTRGELVNMQRGKKIKLKGVPKFKRDLKILFLGEGGGTEIKGGAWTPKDTL